MEISQAGIDFIKGFEKLSLVPYLDQAGLLTIGYGHLIVLGEHFTMITEQQAEDLIEKDLSDAESCINKLVKVGLTQDQYDALVSLVFNIGVFAFRNSTLLKLLNAGKYASAANQFLVWNKVTINSEKIVSAGLTRRRQQERNLFLEEQVAA